ncbi:hypothetical protein ABZU76_36925 [Amycolatopsis sp. NPDC005232]|uniref:hypothetical protein n=1 Tax=Amycolatopsis sp. NPDC005232 TaxID=3157027 RepID=UPI0033A30476
MGEVIGFQPFRSSFPAPPPGWHEAHVGALDEFDHLMVYVCRAAVPSDVDVEDPTYEAWDDWDVQALIDALGGQARLDELLLDPATAPALLARLPETLERHRQVVIDIDIYYALTKLASMLGRVEAT